MFGRKQDNPAIVLSYAALEGLFLGAISFLLANFMVSGASAGAPDRPGGSWRTLGVFVGMLVVYKTGAIRVTPKFTRMIVAPASSASLALALGNFVLAMFTSVVAKASACAAAARWRSSSRWCASASRRSAS